MVQSATITISQSRVGSGRRGRKVVCSWWVERSPVQEGGGDVGSTDGQVGGDVSIAREKGQVRPDQLGQGVVCSGRS